MSRKAQRKTLDEQMNYLLKGTVEVIREDELRAKLEQSAKSGKPLRVKAGFDPTAPDLHLGHTVLLRKMKHFQDLGHTVIFLIGDFTGLIGDPSGRSATRPPMTRAEIDRNAETYKAQVLKILDPERTVIDFNWRWLGKLTAEDFIRLCSRYTLARMLERDDFHQRLEKQLPISIHELLYPLAQAYDSVALEADVELGGSDQKFNLLVGREIQREYGQPTQVVMTMPLLEGLDGVQKMSKSYGNAIGIQEPSDQMFGKLMSISDELMMQYYELLTDLSPAEIDEMGARMRLGQLHPMQAKIDLAKRIVADFHSAEAAEQAAREFERVFSKGEAPAQVEEIRIPALKEKVVSYKGKPHYQERLSKILVEAKLAPSRSEAERLIRQGAVELQATRYNRDDVVMLGVGGWYLIHVGKTKWVRVYVMEA